MKNLHNIGGGIVNIPDAMKIAIASWYQGHSITFTPQVKKVGNTFYVFRKVDGWQEWGWIVNGKVEGPADTWRIGAKYRNVDANSFKSYMIIGE